MMVHAVEDARALAGRSQPKPPPAKIWAASEPPFEGYKPAEPAAYRQSGPDTAIIIDNGKSRQGPYVTGLSDSL